MSPSKKSQWLKKITKWIKNPLGLFQEKTSVRRKVRSRKKISKPKTSKKVVKKTAAKRKSARPRKAKLLPRKTVKKPLKKIAAKFAAKKQKVQAAKKEKTKVVPVKKEPGIFVGKITHYFPKAGACAIQIEKAELKEGAVIRIVGSSTDFKMTVKSIQINRIPVPSGRPGEDVGIGVGKPVSTGDAVYLV